MLNEGEHVLPTCYTGQMFSNSIQLDITNLKEVKTLFLRYKPDIVIHTAAETNVELCEANPNRAFRINAEGARNVSMASKRIGSLLVFISTGYVFDGKRGQYLESDTPKPLNNYGRSKLAGEKAVKTICDQYLIVRTSLLYGWHPWKHNFTTWAISELRARKMIGAIDDHYNNPTLANNLAEAILEAINKGLRGIYHIAGCEKASRYEFAVKIAEVFDLPVSLIKRVRGTEISVWKTTRPRNPTLSVRKAQSRLSTNLLDLEMGLTKMAELENAEGISLKREQIAVHKNHRLC
jgi:dTDP-4-dehydrorhamnose reductase